MLPPYTVDKTLIITVGLPYAGKTTWARSTGYPMVIPDAIRRSLGVTFEPLLEPHVWAMARTMVRSLFWAGHPTVVLVATNTTQKRRAEWIDPAWDRQIKLFADDQATCLERADRAGDKATYAVIERMAAQFEELSMFELPHLWTDDPLTR